MDTLAEPPFALPPEEHPALVASCPHCVMVRQDSILNLEAFAR